MKSAPDSDGFVKRPIQRSRTAQAHGRVSPPAGEAGAPEARARDELFAELKRAATLGMQSHRPTGINTAVISLYVES